MSKNLTVGVLAAALAVSLVLGTVGCSSGSGEKGGKNTPTVAAEIQNGGSPLVATQRKCPVCSKPITPDVHTESKQDRVYFDRKECLEKWQQNPDKYKENLMNQRM